MSLQDMQQRADTIDSLYRPNGGWGLREYAEGLVGDVGDLMKLVMAKEGLRHKEDVDRRTEHEINDIMWSVLMLYKSIGKDPSESFMAAMNELETRILGKGDSK